MSEIGGEPIERGAERTGDSRGFLRLFTHMAGDGDGIVALHHHAEIARSGEMMMHAAVGDQEQLSPALLAVENPRQIDSRRKAARLELGAVDAFGLLRVNEHSDLATQHIKDGEAHAHRLWQAIAERRGLTERVRIGWGEAEHGRRRLQLLYAHCSVRLEKEVGLAA